MSEVTFVSGGSVPIGCSFSLLKLGNYHFGADWGGGYNSPDDQPQYDGPLDALWVSHGHLDHVEKIPVLVRKYPNIKVYTTQPTADFSLLMWWQSIKIAKEKKRRPSFDEQDIKRALNAMVILGSSEEVQLTSDIRFCQPDAGHILGAKSLLVEYEGEHYFLTNDISFRDRNLIPGAPKFNFKKGRCRLLVRESTYINKKFEDREETNSRLIESARAVLQRRGRLLVSSLAVDRTQDIFATFHKAGLGPIYTDGGFGATKIYLKHLGEKAAFLTKTMRFKNDRERAQFLKSREPAIIIASSGMVYPNTLSAVWAENLMCQPNDAIFLVNYQDPDGQGYVLKTAPHGNFVVFNDSLIKVVCERKAFNCSAHMDGPEGTELEERLNPDVTIYGHGESAEIDRYIAEHRNGRTRLRAETGKEVEL